MKELHITMNDIPTLNYAINACIGYFDGIHIGHQHLIKAVVSASRRNGAIPALITFDPDPWAVIKGLKNLTHLTTMEERKAIGEAQGIELWIILKFTKEMASLSVDAFHKQILYPLHLQLLVCGYDFRYADGGRGNTATLQNQDRFDVLVVEEVMFEEKKISSSRIEQLLEEGELEEAEMLLARPYSIQGIVIHGLQNGRKMGFPTANLQLQEAYVCPKEGVYAGEIEVNGVSYGAMINIGKHPTFNDFHEQSIEGHLFDFEGDLYGLQVTFIFLHYLRGDVKFTGMDALAMQLAIDKRNAKHFLMNRKERLQCD